VVTLIFIDLFVSTERLVYITSEMQYTEIHTNSVSNYSNASKRDKISSMSLAIPYVKTKCDHIKWIWCTTSGF